MKQFLDKAWWSQKEPASFEERGLKLKSIYIDMSDGVKIAADIYLPKNMRPDEKLPTVFHQTRMTRRYALRQPFKYFIERSKRYFYNARIKKFLNKDYAVVSIDQRASGASFGIRTREWEEIDSSDGFAVLNWIVKQPWSDGRTILLGADNSAVSTELLLAKHHPSIKAAVLISSPFDLYTDLLCPGGVKNERFIYYWLFYNYYRDMDQIPSMIPELKRLFLFLVTKGSAGASKNRKIKKALKAAIAQRNQAFYYDQIKKFVFRDDPIMNGLIDQSSPHSYLRELNTSNVPICSIAGWFDGAYSLGAIKRFMNVQNHGSCLILGPWSNNRCLSLLPFPCRRHDSSFDQTSAAIRFMDYNLRGTDNGVASEERVHYYTLGSNIWQSSPTWPPANSEFHNFYFRTNNIVITNSPSKMSGKDNLKFNYRTTTGESSRWASLLHVDCNNVDYKASEEQDDLSLIYATPPFEEDFEITGSPVISLYVKSNITDIQLFVYLGDVFATGNMVYITEGLFRTIHKRVNNLQSLYEVPYPTHTFLKKEASFLSPIQESLVTFDLLPVSYLIKKSHSLRIRITGSDKGNFEIIGPAPEIAVCHGINAPSSIKIPGRYISHR